MFKSLLIANRGEIARRIIRTARRLGIRTVAVASEADLGQPFAREADRCIAIGPGPATESYLRIDRIVAAARETGAEAIHPGYGFLSENADFADAVAAAGLVFVGPTGDAMRALGGKASAKEIAAKAGVPVVPGYQGAAQDLATLADAAAAVGYPVMIKAVAGGGGRGMRLVARPEELAPLLESAVREAESAFGDGRVLIEKVVVAPRHIEVQVFGDRHGNVVHLFERDCSLQRRNQKVIEEAPAPGMSPELRTAITGAAVKLARAVGYQGAGTVEFLVEGGTLGADARWYFIEMNTRLQVEHPVTEAITGLDLVEWQLRVAAGEPLPLAQDAIALCGHAIEARLCAEDPARGFLPSIGRIAEIRLPAGEGLRADFGPGSGDAVSPFYDSMIGKLIAHGRDRGEAVARLRTALAGTVVAGLQTNALFLDNLLAHAEVGAGTMDTGLIGRDIDGLAARPADAKAAALGALALIAARRSTAGPAHSPWDADDGFGLGSIRRVKYDLTAEGLPVVAEASWGPEGLTVAIGEATAHHDEPDPAVVVVDASRALVTRALSHTTVAWPVYDIAAVADGPADGLVRAPINGKLAKLFVAVGASVEKGDRVAIVEAMKMEHLVQASRSGQIATLPVAEGAQVTERTVLATIAE
jgi:3-methylcrotonyl-CoA carboxylase alpha subunit